jgi:hypothetical protein
LIRIWVTRAPIEWPMMTGFSSSLLMMAV